MPELARLLIWYISLTSTLVLVGLVWTVHMVIYPLFDRVGPDHFTEYHAAYVDRIGRLVAPLMLIELSAAVVAAIQPPDLVGPLWAWSSLAMVLVVWGLTMAVHVPQHGRLAHGWHPTTGRSLVTSHRWRTWAWTLRGVVVVGVSIAPLL